MSQTIEKLPTGWAWVKLGEVCEINPKFSQPIESEELEVSFLPMKRVAEESGELDLSETKTFRELKKGFTPFENGDVIFAKITPCMENGKAAVLRDLKNGIGFGSTEFFVFRSSGAILNTYLFQFIIQKNFREEAKRQFAGAVGQQRVPRIFLENKLLPLPPLPEQKRIVAKLETLLAHLARAEQALAAAELGLGRFRQSVLKEAFRAEDAEGKLKEGWRWVKLGEVCEKIQDGSHFSPKKQFPESGEGLYKYITAKNIRNGYMDLSNVTYVEKEFHDSIYTRCNPEFGDVLLTKDGVNTGEVTLNELAEPFSLLSSVCLLDLLR
ncbi:MAG: restriction endonuclease subunit S [Saprospiraceae bacterium]